MKNTVDYHTLKKNNCVGCGICKTVCPTGAITMHLNRYNEYIPSIDYDKCSNCGICVEFCLKSKLEPVAEIDKKELSDGLNSSEYKYLIAHDADTNSRRKSASGGAVTALIKNLLNEKVVDAVIHAEMCESTVGGVHYRASVSTNAEACESKRSSFYTQILYSEVIEQFRDKDKVCLVVGVPCAINAIKNLFQKHESFSRNKLYTIALACGRNANNQFIDFLAESLGITKDKTFKVNLRNKDNIKNAHSYNNHFFNEQEDILKINRYDSQFTKMWRNYYFAIDACLYCTDFWGSNADISVKDAWGKWAENPLGNTIMIVRDNFMLQQVLRTEAIEYEYLNLNSIANSQQVTIQYKQLESFSKFNEPFWGINNIKNGMFRYLIISRMSKFFYRYFGYKITSKTLSGILKVINGVEKVADKKVIKNQNNKRTGLFIEGINNKKIILFGTGQMAQHLMKGLKLKIYCFVDNDKKRQQTVIAGKTVKNPESIMDEDKEEIVVIVASMYYDQIAAQLKDMELIEGRHFLDARPIYELLDNKKIKKKLKNFISNNRVCLKVKQFFLYQKPKPYNKILVLGGYGYKNTGDEAQLNATLKLLRREFPEYLLKVLTPDPYYTHFEHEGCLVGDAPRIAFYDQGETQLYTLRSRWLRMKFLAVSGIIYMNAFLVRAGLPTFMINAKKASLLNEIQTSDLVFFCGGGYLTGRTLSRLWDGMFFIRIANVFGVPSVLSGQTIGVWNGNFNKKIGKWGLSKASIITLRDPEDSESALREIGIYGRQVYTTCDDALFCEKLENQDEFNKILESIGINVEGSNEKYFTFNIHYWGLNTDEEKQLLLSKIDRVVKQLLEGYNYKILLIPMIPSDEDTMNDYMQQYPHDRLKILKYDYDFRKVRAAIGKSFMCITMKHHPIIFALGESIPVISLSHGDYYRHKNSGALKLFGLDMCNVMLEDEAFEENFRKVMLLLQECRGEFVEKSVIELRELNIKKEHFIMHTKEVIK